MTDQMRRERMAAWLGLSEEKVRKLEEWAERPHGHATLDQVTQAEVSMFSRDVFDQIRAVRSAFPGDEDQIQAARKKYNFWESIDRRFHLFGREYRTLGEWFAAHEQNAREVRRQQADLEFRDQLEKQGFGQSLPKRVM